MPTGSATWSVAFAPPSTADGAAVLDVLLELALPRTDAGVAVQWAVMVPVWIVALVTTRNASTDVRRLVQGLVLFNLAWFVVRTAH